MNPTPSNRATVKGLQPAIVWELFADIGDVPRPSKDEARIRSHIRALAKKHDLGVQEDAVGNLVITVPASAGHEAAPITVLQAHVDMVCEKNRSTQHDFTTTGIRFLRDTDRRGTPILRADGTTLGADNGIGVAMALGAALDPEVVHGPLELLLTVDEEDGMTGAKSLTPQSFKGRRLINLDSEEDDRLYIGCAGGCDTTLTWTASATAATGKALSLDIRGLRGGHSGCDIHENRGNAIKLLTRVLSAGDPAALQLAELRAGNKRNAIPREAQATVCGSAAVLAAVRAAAESVQAALALESDEPDAVFDLADAPTPPQALSPADSTRILSAAAAISYGVQGMSVAVPGLVQTSNNLATLHLTWDGPRASVQLGTLTRSSLDSRIAEVCGQIAAIGRLAGAVVTTANEYPGWEPDIGSAVLGTARRVYEAEFGEAPHVMAIHAGLECGIIQERVGKMDMVSCGPRIEAPHSPDERVYIGSVDKSWRFLKALLADLAA